MHSSSVSPGGAWCVRSWAQAGPDGKEQSMSKWLRVSRSSLRLLPSACVYQLVGTSLLHIQGGDVGADFQMADSAPQGTAAGTLGLTGVEKGHLAQAESGAMHLLPHLGNES